MLAVIVSLVVAVERGAGDVPMVAAASASAMDDILRKSESELSSAVDPDRDDLTSEELEGRAVAEGLLGEAGDAGLVVVATGGGGGGGGGWGAGWGGRGGGWAIPTISRQAEWTRHTRNTLRNLPAV